MSNDGGSLRAASAAGLVVVASVAAVDPGGWYPFVVAKFAAVSIAVVAMWWVCATCGGPAVDRSLTRLFVALVGVLALAAVVGRDPLYAWTGTPERHLGVATWLLFLAAFTSGGRLAEPAARVRVARWLVACGLGVGIYAVVERWWEPITAIADTQRLGGTYGSAAFLGAALCLLVPISIAVAITEASAGWRTASLAATATCSAALVGSGARAAALGLGVGSLVLLAARGRSLALRSAVAPAVAAAVGLAFAASTAAAAVQRVRGGGSRLDEWRLGWGVVWRHPLLGLGPEGYRTSLADGVTAGYERTYGREVLPDRAHNVLLDVAAAGGVVTALLYLTIAVAVAVAGWRLIRRGSALEAGFAVAAIAYLAQQIFLFPVATIDPVFWMIAGSLVTAGRSAAPAGTHRARLVATVAVPVLVVLFASGVAALAADRAARTALDRANSPGAESAASRAAVDRAIALRPDVIRYRVLAAEVAPPTVAGIDLAIADLEAARRVSPHDPIVQRRLADERTRRAIATGTAGDVAASREAWQDLVAADSLCYPCQLGLGYAAALDGDVTAAQRAFSAAAALEPAGRSEADEALAELALLDTPWGTDRDG